MTIVNPLRHPQTLFLGFPEGDHRLSVMQELVGASRIISGDDFGEIRGADWDLLIAEGVDLNEVNVPNHLYILAFNCHGLGEAIGTSFGWGDSQGSPSTSTVYYMDDQFSSQLRVAIEVPDAIKRLVQSESVSELKDRSRMPYLNIGMERRRGGFSAKHCVTFLADADENIVCGEFQRSRSGALVWTLPYASRHPSRWLLAALGEWRRRKPDIFPESSPWRESPRWMTSEEMAVVAEQEELRDERQAAEIDFTARQIELAERTGLARVNADAGLRRLLTEQGEVLVTVVTDVLLEMGFTVIDRDQQRENEKLGKVEDLEVVDPSNSELRVIAEVKGYTKRGASQRDLAQLAEHAVAFTERNGKAPDRRWYIVNQCAQEPPDSRPAPLASVKEHREIFARSGGLIIDSRELFRMARDIEMGALTPEDARALLMNRTDILTYSEE